MANHLSSAVISTYFGFMKAVRSGGNTYTENTSAPTSSGGTVLTFASHSFVADRMISYTGDDGKRRSVLIVAVDATTVTIATPVPAGVTILTGTAVIWTWTNEGHLNTLGYEAFVDHMFDQINNDGILGDKKIVYNSRRLFAAKNASLIGTAIKSNNNVLVPTTSVASGHQTSIALGCSSSGDGVKFRYTLKAGTYKVKSATLLGVSGSILNLKVMDGVTELASTSVTSYAPQTHSFDLQFTVSALKYIDIEFTQTGTLDTFEIGNIEILTFETSTLDFDNAVHTCIGDSWGSPLFSYVQTKITNGTFNDVSVGAKTAGWVDDEYNNRVTPTNPDFVWIFLSHVNDLGYGNTAAQSCPRLISAIKKAHADGTKPIILKSVTAGQFPFTALETSREMVLAPEYNYLISEDQDAMTFTSIDKSYGTTGEKAAVTIAGTGFGASQGSGSVKIGLLDVSITSWSDTEIVGSMPLSSAGYYDLQIENDSGNSVAVESAFAFVAQYGDSKSYRKIQRDVAQVYVADEDIVFGLSESGLSDVVSGAARSDGLDIVITDVYGTLIPREITVFSKGTGKLQLWTKDPINDVFIGGTELFMQWAGPTVNVANSTGVWADYALVAHMEETSGNFLDSSVNGYDGVPVNPTYGVTAPLNDGGDTATNTTINFGDVTQMNGASKMTLSLWMRVDSDPANRIFLRKSNLVDKHIQISSAFEFIYYVLSDTVSNYRYNQKQPVTYGTWYYVSMIFDNTRTGDSRFLVYLNGGYVGTAPASIPATTPDLTGYDFYIGNTSSALSFLGGLDELRVSTKALDSNQLHAQYNNQLLYDTNGTVDIDPALSFVMTVFSVIPGSGPEEGGTPIIVTGTGFLGTQGTGLLQIDGNNVSITSWSDTQIEGTTPAGTGVGDVYIINDDSEEYTLPGGFTYSSISPVIMCRRRSAATSNSGGF